MANQKKPQTSRLTISLPAENYSQVLKIAATKRVSAAWVIREAIDEYVKKDVPLFAQLENREN